ncbi:MAG: methyl-accepting chemotaxis protein [Dasania sp.]|jgi:methyl-accepting chemotaxis protein
MLIQSFTNLKTKTKILIGVSIPLILLIVLGGTAYYNVNKLAYTSKWVNHTYKVLQKADAIIAAAVDMETGMRGFLLAGKEEFLDPYKSGQQAFYKLVTNLQETVSDNPQQVARLKEVETTIRDWQTNVTQMQIDFRRSVTNQTQTMDNMAILVGEAQGKQYFNKFRGLISKFKAEEQHLIDVRQKANDITLQNTFNIIAIISGVSLILGLGFAWITGNGIAGPLNRMTGNMSRLADGDTSIKVDGLNRKDEIGDIAKALEVFKDNRIETDRLTEQENIRISEERRRDVSEKEQAQRDLEARQAQATREQKAAQELANVVDACASGDFTKRLNTHDKEGIFLSLCEGINEIGNVADTGLNEIKQVLNALSNGKLNVKMSGNYKGIFDDIKISFNDTVFKLTDIVSQISESSESVYDASSQIVTGSSNLSERTDQQAASLEETAASMEELTSTVHNNSNNANNANELSAQASKKAVEGGNVVDDVVTAMNNIEQSSSKISDIIGVIDQISSQINLLALNAAVEAARAGEAGKGFAVVASEVRSLAVRSANASSDIRALIGASSSEVTNGSNLVKNANNVLKDIVVSVQQVSDIIANISVASREQSTSLSEINSAVSLMDDMTQKNAVMVDENSQAARLMIKQAETLKNLVNFFEINTSSRLPNTLNHLRNARAS